MSTLPPSGDVRGQLTETITVEIVPNFTNWAVLTSTADLLAAETRGELLLR